MDLIKEYKEMLNEAGMHEIFMTDFIETRAAINGFKEFNPILQLMSGDKVMFKFRDKFIALVKVGKCIIDGANIIVSHLDSPRLDVMTGQPMIEKEDGVFLKVIPYGGIIAQSWLDRPLALVGRFMTKDGQVLYVDTRDKFDFTISSLLPHLDGRKEMKELKFEKLLVRIGNNKKDNIIEKMKEDLGIEEENFAFAELSFVPSDKVREMGFDKELLAGYGHDDKSCAFAELQAFFDAENTDRTQMAIFASYEETGSAQNTGCRSEFIDDIFLDLIGSAKFARDAIKNSCVISADVCAAFESTYSNHFEDAAKAISGKGTAIVPYLGRKSGNDSDFEFRNKIKLLADKHEIKYSIETTKVSEGGGGTVSTFFATKGCRVIDIGVPVLAMHSPQELIAKTDLIETYKMYKLFYEEME